MKRIAVRFVALTLIFAATPYFTKAATVTFDFSSTAPGTITDSVGNGVGFTHRFPGTGGSIPANDPNMTLNTAAGTLTIMTTTSDLNAQRDLGIGEYLGIQLSSLGFTGTEDFTVSATFLDSVFTQNFDQFGIIIGVASDINFRTGPLHNNGPLIYAANNVGPDARVYNDASFAPLQGDDFTITASRQGGVYSFAIDNLTTPALSGQYSVTFPPKFLNLADDLMVGIYAASRGNLTPKPVTLDQFEVSVGPVLPPAHPGDFDSDGDVDGADFLAWQMNFPTAGGAAPDQADADGDGDVDGADFVVWQTNFPFMPSSGSPPVPEPTAAVLSLVGGLIALGHRRVRRRKD